MRQPDAWMWSVDGEDFVDYLLLAKGQDFLGHAPEPVLAAVSEACRNGLIYGGEHPLEVEAAEAVCDALGWAETWCASKGTGSDKFVQAALRLARAATGLLYGRPSLPRDHYHWLAGQRAHRTARRQLGAGQRKTRSPVTSRTSSSSRGTTARRSSSYWLYPETRLPR